MIPELCDFEGRWRIARQIEDRKDGLSGHFTGTAAFDWVEDEALRYVEEGTLTLGKGPPLRAVRRYRWYGREGRIAVHFADGKPFHSFAPEHGIGTHFCVPDLYRVTYDFTDWPRWTARWDVSGPKKNYTSTSLYLPA